MCGSRLENENMALVKHGGLSSGDSGIPSGL